MTEPRHILPTKTNKEGTREREVRKSPESGHQKENTYVSRCTALAHLDIEVGGVTRGARNMNNRRAAACVSAVAYAAMTAAPTIVSNGRTHSSVRRSVNQSVSRVSQGSLFAEHPVLRKFFLAMM